MKGIDFVKALISPHRTGIMKRTADMIENNDCNISALYGDQLSDAAVPALELFKGKPANDF